MDVWCGTGSSLVTRLARELPEVTGIEPDEASASLATASASTFPNVRIVHTPFPQNAGARFDLVSMVAVLHHMALIDGIRAARQAVAPGGRLIIVGAYRETSADLPLSVLSLLLNPLVGVVRHPKRANRHPQQMTAPMATPVETFRQIKSAMQTELPGVSVHRVLFWRYVATWTASAR